MIINSHARGKSVVASYQRNQSKLSSSMAKLSSGDRFSRLEGSSAGLGISQRFRSSIGAIAEASRGMQNITSRLQSTDAHLQGIQDVLHRMSELSVAAADGSKTAHQRINLDTELQTLNEEIARLSDQAKYDDVQVASDSSILVWDAVTNRMVYSQMDGTKIGELDIDLGTGNMADNGIYYAFEDAQGRVGNFTLTEDGNNLIYVAKTNAPGVSANRTIMNLDLRDNTLKTVDLANFGYSGYSAFGELGVKLDDQGRVWVTEPAAAGWSNYRFGILDTETMAIDFGGAEATNSWSGMGPSLKGHGEFAVYQDDMYHFDEELNVVRQNLYDTSDKEILVTDDKIEEIWNKYGYTRLTFSGLELPYNLSTFSIALSWLQGISQDGSYVAMEMYDNSEQQNHLVVLDTSTGKYSVHKAGGDVNSIASVDFDSNNNIYWTATGGSDVSATMKRARIHEGNLTDIEVVHNTTDGHLGAINDLISQGQVTGFSVSGGRVNAGERIETGSGAAYTEDIATAAISLRKLGLLSVNITTADKAEETMSSIKRALEIVSNERANIGAQVTRSISTIASNTQYHSNLSQSEQSIRSSDIAKETSEITMLQIMSQLNLSVMHSSKGNVMTSLDLLG